MKIPRFQSTQFCSCRKRGETVYTVYTVYRSEWSPGGGASPPAPVMAEKRGRERGKMEGKREAPSFPFMFGCMGRHCFSYLEISSITQRKYFILARILIIRYFSIQLVDYKIISFQKCPKLLSHTTHNNECAAFRRLYFTVSKSKIL